MVPVLRVPRTGQPRAGRGPSIHMHKARFRRPRYSTLLCTHSADPATRCCFAHAPPTPLLDVALHTYRPLFDGLGLRSAVPRYSMAVFRRSADLTSRGWLCPRSADPCVKARNRPSLNRAGAGRETKQFFRGSRRGSCTGQTIGRREPLNRAS